ncbi:amidase family protein [Pseudoalteromonas phenolica]|uniref:amidase family protein n=1 Tax=Pseudoalteromonas phenolica TaxID=161398 RepID=UPI00110A4E2E|nr:amidase family protein [Pseudoalteromonas phenolica]TMO58272.1 amidase [Pseudoalteromonas phenolica]
MIKNCMVVLSLLISSSALSQPKDFSELTINQLHQGVKAGQFTFAEVTQYYLSNIQKHNPQLNAVITVNPDAYQQALNKDKRYKESGKQGILFGVPVLIKDNIDTKLMATTAGALALQNHYPSKNAPIVEKLLSEGAIILGKANLSEWANFKSSPSSSGYSHVGGQVKNPYDLTMTPCGSSSGSAVAVSSNLALVSIGTETDGSIHCPSALNGVVGFKPSIHHISQAGIIPIAHSQDTAGPITRTVTDAQLTYLAISEYAHKESPSTHSLQGKRIGVIPGINQFNQTYKAEFEDALKRLGSAGVTIVNDIQFNNMDKIFPAEFDVLLFEFNHGVTAYLANTGDGVSVKSLHELIEYNKKLNDQQQGLLLASLQANDEAKYKQAVAAINKYAKQQLKEIFKQHKLDAIIAPSVGSAWKIDPINGDKFTGSSSTLAAVTGSPSITIPMGLKDGMPYAVSIIGDLDQDMKVLEIANLLEQLTQGRVAPKL